MADEGDRAADAQQITLEDALARQRAKLNRGPARDKLGNPITECDCGEEISPLRQNMGATRCVPCQSRAESLAKQFRRA